MKTATEILTHRITANVLGKKLNGTGLTAIQSQYKSMVDGHSNTLIRTLNYEGVCPSRAILIKGVSSLNCTKPKSGQ